MNEGLARQALGQRSAHRSDAFRQNGRERGRHGGLTHLEILKRQFQLGDLLIDLFGGSAELHPAKLGELELKLLDLQGVGEKLGALLEDDLL